MHALRKKKKERTTKQTSLLRESFTHCCSCVVEKEEEYINWQEQRFLYIHKLKNKSHNLNSIFKDFYNSD